MNFTPSPVSRSLIDRYCQIPEPCSGMNAVHGYRLQCEMSLSEGHDSGRQIKRPYKRF
jgi:hypothetical protein